MTPRPFDATPARITVFETPVIGSLLRWLSIGFLKILGWRTVPDLPTDSRWLAVIAPHTSYWDFFILVAAALKHRIRARWLGKHTFFRGPGGPLFRWLGGIPTDPTRRGEGRVSQVVDVFRASEELRVAIAPEAGFRRVKRWRTGFYYIALEAGIPLVLAYLDYGTKTVGAGDHFVPTGDVEADFARIRRFYAPMEARHPERFTLPENGGSVPPPI
jgi:1-acyl-sn-glycerol-3-phosphate acyltransferase